MDTKKTLLNFVLFFFSIIILVGCNNQTFESDSTATSSPIPTNTVFPPTSTPTTHPTLTPTNAYPEITEESDYLLYLLEDEHKLFLFDPTTETHIPILPDWEVGTFTVSSQNQLALSSINGIFEDIFLLDFPFWINVPINITNTPEKREFPQTWSPDGTNLLLTTNQIDDPITSQWYEDDLIVWDGVAFTKIHEFLDGSSFGAYESDWSPDGRFAFAEYGNFQLGSYRIHLYVWDGDPSIPTVRISLSTNEIDDRFPKWSPEGNLSFLRNSEKIIVWNGQSFANGEPDPTTFQEIAPAGITFTASPTWDNAGNLVFQSKGVFYSWDGVQTHKIKLFNSHGWAAASWGPGEYWVTTDAVWDNPSQIYVHNLDNETILETEGWPSPSWSPEGNLAFCVYHYPEGFGLSFWDEKQVIEIIKYDGYISARWKNDKIVICSNG